MKQFIVFSIIICLLCCKTEDSHFCYEYERSTLFLDIQRGDSTIITEYLYAYGIGKTAKIFKSNSYDFIANYSDTLFVLPLNFSSDTCKYSFVRKDLSEDTIAISYKRRFYASGNCYFCDFNDKQLNKVSNKIIKDSSTFKDNALYYMPKLTIVRQ